MKRITKILAFVLFAFFSFLFFFYLSFPYDVLKEAMAVKISEATGLSVRIHEISPKIPFGIKFKNLEISSPGGESFKLEEIQAKISSLPLLWGKLNVWVELTDTENGSLELESRWGIFGLLADGSFVPSTIAMESQKFHFGSIVQFLLVQKAKNPDTDLMLKPVLEKIGVSGSLTSDVNLRIDTSDLGQSQGLALMNFEQASLNFEPGLQLPNQVFQKALIKASLSNGVLKFDQTSGLQSTDFSLSLSGQVTQKPEIDKSILDVEVGIELQEALKKQFGFILDAMAKHSTEGKIKIKVSGALAQPQVSIL